MATIQIIADFVLFGVWFAFCVFCIVRAFQGKPLNVDMRWALGFPALGFLYILFINGTFLRTYPVVLALSTFGVYACWILSLNQYAKAVKESKMIEEVKKRREEIKQLESSSENRRRNIINSGEAVLPKLGKVPQLRNQVQSICQVLTSINQDTHVNQFLLEGVSRSFEDLDELSENLENSNQEIRVLQDDLVKVIEDRLTIYDNALQKIYSKQLRLQKDYIESENQAVSLYLNNQGFPKKTQ